MQQNFKNTLCYIMILLAVAMYLLCHTSHVSIGFSPVRSRSATCFGIIWYSNSSVRRISSSSFLIDSSNFFDFCCSWSNASFSSTDCWVPASIRSLPVVIFMIHMIQHNIYWTGKVGSQCFFIVSLPLCNSLIICPYNNPKHLWLTFYLLC